MFLIIPNLAYQIPACMAPDNALTPGPMLDVRLPANDPRGLSLTPKMRVTLVHDDGRTCAIVLGSGWTTHHKGSVMRIPYTETTATPRT